MQQAKSSKKLVATCLIGLALFQIIGLSMGAGVAASEANELKAEDNYSKSLPASLYRFLLYTNKPSLMERQANLMGYKRSSGALDALTGVTLGKRGGSSVGGDYLLNLEPYFGRHFTLRSSPRPYELRWSPNLADSFEES